VSFVNYWILLTAVATAFMWGWSSKFAPDDDIPALILWIAGSATGFVIAVLTIRKEFRRMRPRAVLALGGVLINPGELPRVENLLVELAIAVGAPPVQAALLDDAAPNALAVGYRPKDTTILITTGLVEKFTRDELEAVLAVEMCSIRRLDTAMQSVALAANRGAIWFHRQERDEWKDPRAWIWILLTWPSMVVAELARSRAMRWAGCGADDMAVAVTRHPEALCRSLEKLRDDPTEVALLDELTAPLWFEPVPHDDPDRAREFRSVAVAPTLAHRLERLQPLVRQDTDSRLVAEDE
jgi:heat shock protein HtpX